MQRSAFILSLLLLAGCAQKNSDQSVTSPADFVAVTLGQAAENAHSELAMLAKLRGWTARSVPCCWPARW